MNRYNSILMVLCMILIVLVGCGNDGDISPDPEDTVIAIALSWEDGDIFETRKYCTEQYATSNRFEEYQEPSPDWSNEFYNIETSLLKCTEDTAEVELSFDWKFTFKGETSDERHTEMILCLVRENDIWLIDGQKSAD